jgi:DNA-binding transcriptional regulator YiaG
VLRGPLPEVFASRRVLDAVENIRKAAGRKARVRVRKQPHRIRHIEPQDFTDLRKRADLTRKQAADLLNVSGRTVQNWETGGARIPWMAYRMLRVLTGYALPGKAWEGWTVCGDRLYAPNGRWYEANTLEQVEQVFAMARLWRQDYARSCKNHERAIIPFPDRLSASQIPQNRVAGNDLVSAQGGAR